MLEAAACGCIPLVPDRLAYPEWFDRAHRYASCIEDTDREAHALCDAIVGQYRNFIRGSTVSASPRAFSWQALGPAWSDFLRLDAH